jgi:predicted small secreted protein
MASAWRRASSLVLGVVLEERGTYACRRAGGIGEDVAEGGNELVRGT